MAANYSDLMPGTPVTWKDSGGTKVLSLNGLSNAASRQGDKSGTLIDGTYGFPELLVVDLLIQFNSAPTAGFNVNLYLGWSGSGTAGTDNPGGLGGSDAAGPNVDVFPMLTFAGALVSSNNLGASADQLVSMVVRPVKAYCIPVVENQVGVSLKASSNVSVVTVTPWYRRTPIA